jgi:hypothetical protein
MDYTQSTAALDLKLQYATEQSSAAATQFSSTLPLLPTTNMFPMSGRYAVMYTPSIKGDYTVSAAFAVPGALEATFYDDRSLSRSVAVTTHTSVDFLCTGVPASAFLSPLVNYGWGSGSNITDYSSFSVRWQGFFKPTTSVTSFTVTVRESDERLRLWVDHTLVLNFWDVAPVGGSDIVATFSMVTEDSNGVRLADFNSLYDIKLEYSQSGGQSGIVVPLLTAAHIFTHNTALSTIALSVHPSSVCSSRCRVVGSGLTQATAGVASTFEIMVSDMYGNAASSGDLQFVVRLEPVLCVLTDANACSRPFGTVVYSTANVYSAVYTASMRGSYDIYTFLVGAAASLTATYYSGTLASTGTAINTGFKYSSSMTVPASTASVRYAGFIQPPSSGFLTFSFAYSGTSQVAIFLNRLLTATAGPSSQASSLSASVFISTSNMLYDVRVDFSNSAAYTGSISFSWKYLSSWETIPSQRLFARHDVVSSAGFSNSGPKALPSGHPFGAASVMVSPGATCAAQSLVNGKGISLVTAGVAAMFTLTSRDSCGNDRALNEDIWTVVMSNPSPKHFTAYPDNRLLSSQTYAASSYSSLTGLGRYNVPFTLTAAGNYQVAIFRSVSAGLVVEAFSNSGLRLIPFFTGLDSSVDYNWGGGPIVPACAQSISDFASDFVSLRWTGFVLLDTVEDVTFFVDTSPPNEGVDGAKLWIEGVLLVDTMSSDGAEYGVLSVSAADSLYSVVLEYRATTGHFVRYHD